MPSNHCYDIGMQRNICAFSTASDNYVPYAAVSLLGIRQQNNSIPLYIISSYLSEQSKRFLDRYNIQYIELNLDSYFSKSWEYPIECYYLFAGPQELFQKGFTHSLYIDGDIFCASDPVKNIDLDLISHFGGVAEEPIQNIFGDDYRKILKKWKLPSINNFPRIQTGVIFFNNHAMSEIGFLDKISALYKESIHNNIPRKGDDSLFALFQLIYKGFSYYHLPTEFNFIPTMDLSHRQETKVKIKKMVFFHFTKEYPKPWNIKYTDEYKPFSIFSKKWRNITHILNSQDRKEYFIMINNTLSEGIYRNMKKYFRLW